jgi:DNA-binding NarL/FixJ family response regulator
MEQGEWCEIGGITSLEPHMNANPLRRSRILVAHEDPLVSAGLAAALRQHVQFELLVEGVDALPGDPDPIDVVVTDYWRGVRLTDPAERTALGVRQARILVLTANDREADVRRAVEAGVHGYVLAGGPLRELVDAVTTVANGARHLSPAVAQRIADSLTRTSLTSREMDVLQYLVLGQSNKAIARQLQIEVGTVKSHMTAIMTKLGAASRTQAAGIAATLGLVDERLPPQRPTLHVVEPFAHRLSAWSPLQGGGHAHA